MPQLYNIRREPGSHHAPPALPSTSGLFLLAVPAIEVLSLHRGPVPPFEAITRVPGNLRPLAPITRFHFHSMMLVNFQAFCLSSNCSSPSLLMMSCAAGKRTPSLLLLSLSFKLISPAVRLKLFDWLFQ